MKNFFALVWPPSLGLLLILLGVFAKRLLATTAPIPVQLNLGITQIDLTLSQGFAARFLLVLLGLCLFVFPALRDYSNIFPKYYNMKVYYDDKGVADALAQFKREELSEFNIMETWEEAKQQYFDEVNLEVARTLPAKAGFLFSGDRGSVFTKGNTYFNVIPTKGWQKYRIEKAEGHLEHSCELPGEERITFSSRHELVETGANWIQVTLKDIYMPTGWRKILFPLIKQVYQTKDGNETCHHILIAVTRVRFFPVQHIGSTVYLYSPNASSKTVPVAYAEYTTD